MPLREDS